MSGNIAGHNDAATSLREIQANFHNNLSRLQGQHRRLVDAVGILIGNPAEKPPTAQTAPIATTVVAELHLSVFTLSDMTNDVELVIDRLFNAIGSPSASPGQAIYQKH